MISPTEQMKYALATVTSPGTTEEGQHEAITLRAFSLTGYQMMAPLKKQSGLWASQLLA